MFPCRHAMTTPTPEAATDGESRPLLHGKPSQKPLALCAFPLLGYALVFTSAFFYSLQGVTQAILIDRYDQPPIRVLFFRSLISTSSCLLYILLRPKTAARLRQLSPSDVGSTLKAGVSCTLWEVFNAYSLKFIIAGNAAALLNTSFVFVYAISYLTSVIVLSRHDFVSVLLGLVGIILIMQPSSTTPTEQLIGTSFGLIAAFFNALSIIYSKEAATAMSFIMPVLAEEAFMLCSATLTGGAHFHAVPRDSFTVNMLLAVNGAFTFLATSLAILGLRNCRADRASVLLIAEIPLTYLLAYLFIAEVPRLAAVLGSAAIVLGTLVLGVDAGGAVE